MKSKIVVCSSVHKAEKEEKQILELDTKVFITLRVSCPPTITLPHSSTQMTTETGMESEHSVSSDAEQTSFSTKFIASFLISVFFPIIGFYLCFVPECVSTF